MSLVSPVLVGRHAELSALSSAVATARSRHGSATFVVGEPGLGKSRLVAEASAAAARGGVRVLRGRAAAGGSAVPFRPLTEAIFSALRADGAPDAASLGPYWPALTRLGQLPAGDDAVDGVDESLVVRAEAVLRLLTVLGEEHGCLLVLEDLHDADADTLAVIDYLVDNVADLPVLLVATVRTDPGAGRDLAAAATARRAARTLRLERLDHDEVTELAARCLDTTAGSIPAATLTQLHRTADGTPFIVEELLGSMLGDGSLAKRGTSWQMDPATSTAVPATVTDAIRKRVERLGPECLPLLEAAAVLGQRFPVHVAAAVAGVDPADAFRLLRPAVDAELVVADEGGDAGWQAFRHALIVDAILGRLLPGERVSLSRTAAQRIEAADTEEPQLAAELWAAGGDPIRAATLFTRAGRDATARGAVLSAVALLERGLALLDGNRTEPPAATADLLEALTQALTIRGDHDRVIGLGARLDEALLVAGASPARRVAAPVARIRAASATGRWEDGEAEIRAARHLAGNAAPPELTAPIDAAAAYLTLMSPRADRLDTAATLAHRAVEAAEVASLPAVACEALEVLARCRRFHDLTAGEELLTRALTIATTHGLTTSRIRVLMELGVIDKLRHAGTERLLEAREIADRAGAVIAVTWIELHLATIYLQTGEYDLAMACAERAGELARQLRMRELEQLAHGARAGVFAGRGQREEMEAALAKLGESVLGYGVEVWGRARATCALLEEDREAALRHFAAAAAADNAVPNIRASGFRSWYLLLRTVVGEGSWAEYDELANSPLAEVMLHRPYIAWTRAVLHGRDGNHDDAAKAAAEALADPINQPHSRYLAGRMVAEVALKDGWGDPITWLRDAEEYFHAEGVPRVAAACRALLRRAGAQVTQRREGHDGIPDPLRRLGVTVREFEVLSLVAERMGDREIAERLFLSPRTVEKHVASLRSRTGTPDRAALVIAARGHLGMS